MRNVRPTGVSIIAILFIVSGILTILLGMVTLFTPIPGAASTTTILLGLLWFALGAFSLAIGWGLWELQNWARYSAIVIQALNLVVGLILGAVFLFGFRVEVLESVFGGIGGTVSFPGMGVGFWIVAALAGIIIWYLLTPEVERAFLPQPEPIIQKTVPAIQPRPPDPLPEPSPRIPTINQYGPEQVQAWLAVQGKGKKPEAVSTQRQTIIGRDGIQCQLVLDDPAVSDRHASIRYTENKFYITDLDSTNHTFVNERRVDRQFLRNNDRIRVGDTTLVFMQPPRQRGS